MRIRSLEIQMYALFNLIHTSGRSFNFETCHIMLYCPLFVRRPKDFVA